MKRDDWLIYGANGYTGEIVARLAASQGLRPILAARGEAVRALAGELGLTSRVFGLDDPGALDRGLDGVAAVIHCAGPFSRTSRPMADACLRTRAHYLDITGEIAVFESLAARDAEAKAAGVMLLPGAGFDVMPSDSLAVHLKRRLPTATRLALAFTTSGGISRGTATTMAENLHRGGMVRRGGRLTPVPPGWKTRRIDFGRGERLCVTIPWGDVATAFHSTGIPDVEVYTNVTRGTLIGLKALRLVRPLLATEGVQSFLVRRIRARPAGPSEARRAGAEARLWGEATDGAGGRAVARLRTPEGYTLTALTALGLVRRILEGDVMPGFQTPAGAYGPDFILGFPGVSREDL